MKMRRNKQFNAPYLIWLIRNKVVTSYNQILAHFDLNPAESGTHLYYLEDMLKNLFLKNIIGIKLHNEQNDKIDTYTHLKFINGVNGDCEISVTDHTLNVLATLDISLTEVANRDYNSILVNPIFNTRSNKKKEYELFVLMPFTIEMKPIYEDHIKNVANDLNLSLARADDFFTSNSIMDEVWQAIFQSKILIADCTGKNPNVFYEIGTAHTIGKPVILITNNKNDIPFDLTHIRYIVYDFTPRGMKEFEKTLRNTIKEINSA